jgi:hypothetical protein
MLIGKITSTEDEAAMRAAEKAYCEAIQKGYEKTGEDAFRYALAAYRNALGITPVSGNEARQLLNDRETVRRLLWPEA